MTIQEIREKIAKTIAGQGSMVDIGGGLPGILNSILDAVEGGGNKPLIVVGTWNSEMASQFTPNEGQPSKEDAVEAFRNGTPVFLDITDTAKAAHSIELVFSLSISNGQLITTSLSW